MTPERTRIGPEQFDARRDGFIALEAAIRRIIGDLLRATNLKVLSIEGRVKDRGSLEEKLNRPGKHYEKLGEVTDLVGLRVVTYFEDDVDDVARILANEFELIHEHCSDRRSFAEPDRFGYRSLHYVCRLAANRQDLIEHHTHREDLFEIQIRSILQHAWAEIEHDLGYKSPVAIPNEIKHQLSRVAGLLEIADRDFREARDQTNEYAAKVAEHINAQSLSGIELNAISYLEFVASSPLVVELDDLLRTELGYEFSQDADEDYVVGSLKWVGIRSIEQLQERLNESATLLRRLEIAVFSNPDLRSLGKLSPAISIFYLAQILALQNGGVPKLQSFYDEFKVTSGTKTSFESAQETAGLIDRLNASLP